MTASMTDILNQVQQDLLANLNTILTTKNLTALTYRDDAPRVETDIYSMGIYLASPDGEVYVNDGQQEKMTITLDCILDDKRDHSNLPQQYLDVVREYLNGRSYGFASRPYTAYTARVDLDMPVNAFGLAMEVVCGVFADYDLT